MEYLKTFIRDVPGSLVFLNLDKEETSVQTTPTYLCERVILVEIGNGWRLHTQLFTEPPIAMSGRELRNQKQRVSYASCGHWVIYSRFYHHW